MLGVDHGGDAVLVRSAEGVAVAKGLCAYDAADARASLAEYVLTARLVTREDLADLEAVAREREEVALVYGETGAPHRGDVLDLIDAVDSEMYQAKRARRDRRAALVARDDVDAEVGLALAGILHLALDLLVVRLAPRPRLDRLEERAQRLHLLAAELAGLSKAQIAAATQTYLDNNPQVRADIQSIRQPSADFRARCGIGQRGLAPGLS